MSIEARRQASNKHGSFATDRAQKYRSGMTVTAHVTLAVESPAFRPGAGARIAH